MGLLACRRTALGNDADATVAPLALDAAATKGLANALDPSVACASAADCTIVSERCRWVARRGDYTPPMPKPNDEMGYGDYVACNHPKPKPTAAVCEHSQCRAVEAPSLHPQQDECNLLLAQEVSERHNWEAAGGARTRRSGRAAVKVTGTSTANSGSFQATCGAYLPNPGKGYAFRTCLPDGGFVVAGDTLVPGRAVIPQLTGFAGDTFVPSVTAIKTGTISPEVWNLFGGFDQSGPLETQGAGTAVIGGKDYFSAKAHLSLPTDAGTVTIDADFECNP